MKKLLEFSSNFFHKLSSSNLPNASITNFIDQYSIIYIWLNICKMESRKNNFHQLRTCQNSIQVIIESINGSLTFFQSYEVGI